VTLSDFKSAMYVAMDSSDMPVKFEVHSFDHFGAINI